MDSILLRNLIAYVIQTSLLAGVSAALLYALRIAVPRPRLACWQGLLALCLLLPGIEPWRPLVVDGSVQISTRVMDIANASSKQSGWHIDLPGLILTILLGGTAIRLALLCAGFWKLYRYRAGSEFAPGAFAGLQRRMNVHADFRVSDEIPSPVTFGVLHPVILFPPGWLDHEAIACHELLHVKRYDWAFTVAEELVRAILWFHPAIWFVLAQIQIAREEAVDREAVSIMNSRERYLNSLLAMAAAKAGLDLAPASLFLRKGHLRKRVASLLKEVSMSKTRLIYSFAAFIPAIALAAWLGIRSFPLQAGEAADAPGVTVENSGAAVLHRAAVSYPSLALERNIQGKITAELTLNTDGTVADARILSGPEELRKAVLASVLEWHYSNDAQLPHTVQVAVDFQLPRAGAPAGIRGLTPAPPAPLNIVKRIVLNVPESMRQKLASRLTLHEGDELTQASIGDLAATLKEVDQHLGVALQPSPDRSGSMVVISLQQAAPASPAAPGRIRVGGNVQATNLLTKVTPVYPYEAKAARIQGTVRFTAVIGKDGTIQDLQLVSGHPLLVPAAQSAVAQWVYKPTLLNGEPVEVVTQIDVNFTLSQ